MKNLNTTIIEGNITKDPELKTLQTGKTLLNFSIASNGDYKKGDEWIKDVIFLDVIIWGKYAESLNDRLAKGVTVIVKGRLKQETWEDKTSGANRSKITLTADEVSIRNRVARTESTKQEYNQPEQPNLPEGAEKYTGPSDSDIPF